MFQVFALAFSFNKLLKLLILRPVYISVYSISGNVPSLSLFLSLFLQLQTTDYDISMQRSIKYTSTVNTLKLAG